MRQCEQCANRLPPEAVFCPRCGFPTERAVERVLTEPPTDRFVSPFAGAPDWHLMLVRPDGEQFTHDLSDRLTIGRSPDNDLQLQDSQVSRVHAMIEISANGYTLSDLGSSNGTYLNRKRVHQPVRLRVGDTITVGQYRLLVQRGTRICGNCARPVRAEDVVCMHCGLPLSGLVEPERPPPLDPAGLRDRSLASAPVPQRPLPENLSFSKAGERHLDPLPPSRPQSRSAKPSIRSRAAHPAPSAKKQAGRRLGSPVLPQRDWLRTCAVLGVIALCLAAAAAAAGYWYLTTFYGPLN